MGILLRLAVIISGFLILYLVYNHSKKPKDTFNNQEIPQTTQKNHKFDSVEKLNEQNDKIKNLIVKAMPVKVSSGNMTFRLYGDLAHEKDKFFRLILSNKLTGRELDIGSNKEIFWFWSKRVNPPALYFAKHEDLWKTNLKAPLNPSWMIESLDVGSINQNKITSYKEEDDILYLYEKRQTADGTDCLFLTVINKKENKVCARKLLDNSMRTIISTIYKDDIIFMEWKDENASMEWNVKGRRTNVSLPDSLWKLPDYKNKIDMGNSLVQ